MEGKRVVRAEPEIEKLVIKGCVSVQFVEEIVVDVIVKLENNRTEKCNFWSPS